MQTSRKDSDPALLADEIDQHDDWRIKCLSSVNEIAVVIDAVVTDMAKLGYSDQDIFGVRLALEEAVCNAIMHGHQVDPTKIVEVRYRVRADDHFMVEVKDQGPGFEPAQVPDALAPENLERPSGRGLFLMRHYAAWVRHNRKGNCVTFCICPSEPLAARDRRQE